MTIIAARKLIPTLGKDSVGKERVKAAAEIFKRHGASSRVMNVVGGEGAGEIHMYSGYSSVASGAKTFEAVGADPDFQALMAKRESDPAGEIIGPEIFRVLYGDRQIDKKVVVQREYHMPRENVPKAMEMMPRLEKIIGSLDIGVMSGVPLIASDHEMAMVIYYFNDLEHWGNSVDQMIASPDFQALVSDANELGTLTCSRLLVDI